MCCTGLALVSGESGFSFSFGYWDGYVTLGRIRPGQSEPLLCLQRWNQRYIWKEAQLTSVRLNMPSSRACTCEKMPHMNRRLTTDKAQHRATSRVNVRRRVYTHSPLLLAGLLLLLSSSTTHHCKRHHTNNLPPADKLRSTSSHASTNSTAASQHTCILLSTSARQPRRCTTLFDRQPCQCDFATRRIPRHQQHEPSPYQNTN